MKSRKKPPKSEKPVTIMIINTANFLLMNLDKTTSPAAFVAGPAIKNTKAVPGETPFIIKAIAIGTEAVEHIYKGIPAAIIMSLPLNPDVTLLTTLMGKNVEIIPAKIMPMSK